MTTVHAVNNLSAYSRVPVKILNSLIDKLNLCIGSAIHDAKVSDKDTVIIDVGIGTLSVDMIEMQCKFVPSKDLKAVIKKSVVDGVDPLEFTLQAEMIERLMNICNEVL